METSHCHIVLRLLFLNVIVSAVACKLNTALNVEMNNVTPIHLTIVMADRRSRHSSYKNAKRRAEAITFLSNISLSGKVEKRYIKGSQEKRHEDVSTLDDDTKDEDGRLAVEPNVNVSIPNVLKVDNAQGKLYVSSVKQRHSASNITNSTLTTRSLSHLHADVAVHETPTSATSSKLRRTLSGSRTRRTSGGATPPMAPSSPTKGGERFFVNRSLSSDVRHHIVKQTPSDPYTSRSVHSSHEELQHVHAIWKLTSLESPPEGAEMDFSRPKFVRRCSSGGRIMLVSSHKSPFAIWSHLRYNRTSQYGHIRRDSEALLRPRVSSVVRQRLLEPQDVPPNTNTLDGVELGGEGKTVSYSHMLIPTLNVSSQSLRKLTVTEGMLGTSPASSTNDREGEPSSDVSCQRVTYDPNQLDDPELISGKHKKIFQFSSYRVSVIDYAKPSALKRDINEKFRARYPGIDLTLSKLRSIKREMKKVVVDECQLDPGILAPAYVYFEKLVLYEKINKENRKLLAGVCLLLSAKLNDIKGADLQSLVKEVEDTFRESRKDLFAFEFPVLVALEFALHIPIHEVMPHYVRLMQT